MLDGPDFDFKTWIPETGVAQGDARENDPAAPGFTDGDDRFYRSHFQHANRLADRVYEQVRAAYRLGQSAASDPRVAGRSFEEVEKDLENGWLNVRTSVGDWASVREFALIGFDRIRQGRVRSGGSPPSDLTG
ncbi:MAG: hypothetical protein JWM41_4046 [Gemmatimonadetes bacterium]|nr:hypothetical protein [Gemmatimonadota bacterium]